MQDKSKSLQGQFYKELERIPVINKFHTHNANTVKAWFYIPAFCSFCDFTNFLYGPSQMPIWTLFSGLNNFPDFTPFLGGPHKKK
jgi:hypothetical protein